MNTLKIPAETVTEAHIQAYERDGVVCIKNAIPMEFIEMVRPAANWCRQNPGPYDRDIAREEGQFYGGQYMWLRNEAFKDFLFKSPSGAVAARLLRSETIQLYYDFLLTKQPGASNPTPWHQDRLYYPLSGNGADSLSSLWIALDPVTLDSGGMEYVAGSHKWQKFCAPEAFNSDSRFNDLDIQRVPDIDGNRDDYRILSWDLAPGDCLVHHVMTVHGSPENHADIERRGLAIRWMTGEVRYDPRPGTVPEQNTVIASEPNRVAPGCRIEGPDFPKFRVETMPST